ncbi:MAG: hypothetical protein O2807_10780 [bacterium]|nr:hypothetical protein [bacterium]
MAPRKFKIRKYKPYLMRYVHGSDPNYEPVLRDILDHEHDVYDELTKNEKTFQRGERRANSWEVVFRELTDVLSPFQVEQLFERLLKDFGETCKMFHEMAETQKLIENDEGGQSG